MSVFANGLGVSGKSTDNKTLAAMPDVCMSPPPPPAGPVPIPYPNFGMASDTSDGCTSVFIKGKEAGKKNASKYSKITGDEPATNSFGAGVVSHKISGALKFAAYSFDVMFEGGGAERFTDLTTTNHMNNPNGASNASIAPPGKGTPPPDPDCEALKNENTAFRVKHNDKVIKKKDGKPVTFDESGTVAHGRLNGGGSPMTGTSATKQLGLADDLGACPPVSTKGIGKFRASGAAENSQFKLMDNPRYEPPPASGPDTRSDSKKAEKPKVVHVKFKVCDEECTHPTGGLEAHAELNILNCVTERAKKAGRPVSGSKLLLAIDWNHEKGKGDTRPCGNCRNLIKKICEQNPPCIQILICNKDGQPIDRCKDTNYDDP
jgi:Domain of unknown function (DUF4150)